MQPHAAAVEEDGWDGLLFMGSQNLSVDVFGSLYLAAEARDRCDQPRHSPSGGRGVGLCDPAPRLRRPCSLGVGRSDTALDLIGVKPPSARRFEVLIECLQTYLQGDTVDINGFGSRIIWLPLDGEPKVSIDVFGSGPKVISVGARLGDRVTVTVGAEPNGVDERCKTLAKRVYPPGWVPSPSILARL